MAEKVNWSVEDRVRHSSMTDWGLGEVREVLGDEKLRVHFEKSGERVLKHPWLTRAAGSDLTQVLNISRPRAAGHKGVKPAKVPQHLTIEAYREVFVRQFPGGFGDPA